MPRGGRRAGAPGRDYPNRSDMRQGVRVAPSQTYGDATAQANAQKVIPLARVPQPTAPPPQAAPPGPAGVLPGQYGPLHGPTNRPQEPITAGLASGPGPGPEALGQSADPTVNVLRGVYTRFPSEDVRQLLVEAMRRAGAS